MMQIEINRGCSGAMRGGWGIVQRCWLKHRGEVKLRSQSGEADSEPWPHYSHSAAHSPSSSLFSSFFFLFLSACLPASMYSINHPNHCPSFPPDFPSLSDPLAGCPSLAERKRKMWNITAKERSTSERSSNKMKRDEKQQDEDTGRENWRVKTHERHYEKLCVFVLNCLFCGDQALLWKHSCYLSLIKHLSSLTAFLPQRYVAGKEGWQPKRGGNIVHQLDLLWLLYCHNHLLLQFVHLPNSLSSRLRSKAASQVLISLLSTDK